MTNPWDDLPSIWDGWTKQCFCMPFDVTGAACAAGHLSRQLFHKRLETREAKRRLDAVTYWLQRRLHVPGIVTANDVLRWTPDQFRDLDRRLEYEYQLGQLQKQVDAITRIDTSHVDAQTIVPAGA